MAKCVKCGKDFDIDEIRVKYEDEFEGLKYDSVYPENDWCFCCAMNDTRKCENIGIRITK